jgi:hypothetical protein
LGIHRSSLGIVFAASVVASLAWVRPAQGQSDPVSELAVQASDVHAAYCADVFSSDEDLAEAARQASAAMWEELDAHLKLDPEPFLLYWRGVMAQCLGRDDQARADLEGFLQAVAYLQAVDDAHSDAIQTMCGDAERRLRRLRRGRVRGGAVRTGAGVELHPRWRAGAGLMVAGGTTAALGFILDRAIYDGLDLNTTYAEYNQGRNFEKAMIAVGVVGCAVGGVGLIVLISSREPQRPAVALTPGPISTLSVRF